MAIIEVNNITKEYRLGQLKSLKQSVHHVFERLRGRKFEIQLPFKALDNVDFKVEQGEVLGIIGTNGAGKSTLLKLLSRINVPTKGSLKVHGKVAPLIEVGAGLVGDLTGRENVYLNGSILGLSRAQVKKKFDEIVAFAELEQFIDTPVKRYSSGMQVRLGFSIATSVDADILIVDEVLAVGDLAFQRKCYDRMEDVIKRQGKTVLLVSHNLRQVERICTRALLLQAGKIAADGPSAEICHLFYERSDERIKKNAAENPRSHKSDVAELIDIHLLDKAGGEADSINYGDNLELVLIFKINSRLTKANFGVGIHTTDFLYLATNITDGRFKDITLHPGIYRLQCRIAHLPFLPGVYSVRVGLSVGELINTVFYAENVLSFQVRANQAQRSKFRQEGFVELEAHWDVEPLEKTEEAAVGTLASMAAL